MINTLSKCKRSILYYLLSFTLVMAGFFATAKCTSDASADVIAEPVPEAALETIDCPCEPKEGLFDKTKKWFSSVKANVSQTWQERQESSQTPEPSTGEQEEPPSQ
jgi:hypothetical protein